MDEECDNQNLRMGIIEEVTWLETVNNSYTAYREYIEAKYKINATYKVFSAAEATKWKENEDIPAQVDVFLSEIMLNLMGSRIRDKYKAFSFIMRSNSLLMISKPPRAQSTATMDFFNVDCYSALLILLCLLLVSAFWSISRHTHISLKSSNAKIKTNILSTSLESLWNSSILFFFEPYIFIPKTLSIRIITGVWLLGVLILNISLGTVMRASFSFVTYELGDNLKDLRNFKNIHPKIAKGGLEERLINLKSEYNEDFRYVRDHVAADTIITTRDYFYSETYTMLKEDEFFFINYDYLTHLLGFLFKEENMHNIFYISQPISEDYMVFPYKFNSSRCHKIKHIFEQVIMDLFETQWVKPIFFRDLNMMEKLRWEIPQSETKAIPLGDLLSVNLLFCYGIILSCIVITIELLSSLFKKRSRKSKLRRKRNRNVWN